MSARDDVLAAVRVALGQGREVHGADRGAHGPSGGEQTASGEAAAATRTQPPSAERALVLDLFAERVADYRATVTRCTAADLAATITAALDGAASVVVPPGSSSTSRARSSTKG